MCEIHVGAEKLDPADEPMRPPEILKAKTFQKRAIYLYLYRYISIYGDLNIDGCFAHWDRCSCVISFDSPYVYMFVFGMV